MAKKNAATASAADLWPRRKLSQSEVQQLWGESWRLCNNPGCRHPCIVDGELPGEGAVSIGEHAHIVAHSQAGPRGDPTMSREQIDSLDNIILLCRICHKVVDRKSNEAKFAQQKLREWKLNHQLWLNTTLPAGLGRIEPAEIAVVCRAVMGAAEHDSADFTLTEIGKKIEKNSLSSTVRHKLRMGLAIAGRVKAILEALGNADPSLPERTRDGFAMKYTELRERSSGDALFNSLLMFAAGGQGDLTRQLAALAVLSYFFHACDVFEA